MTINIPSTHILPIIGIHKSPLTQKFGTPRQPNLVMVQSVIEFFDPYDTPSAFVGLQAYSHIWVFWQFHHNKPQAHFRPQVRPPRLGGNDKLGVFATRSMYRPSQLGLSVVALVSVECVNGRVRLHIKGADMIDGTPIVDIKPYLPYSDVVPNALGFDKPVKHSVILSDTAKQQAKTFGVCDELDVIQSLVGYDPRPAYKVLDTSDFVMRYHAQNGAIDVVFCLVGDYFLIKQLKRVACDEL